MFILLFSGFGAFPVLEVLDLSYNNLSERELPGNFFKLGEFKCNCESWINAE